jgi:type 1 glutamine amidotransferase
MKRYVFSGLFALLGVLVCSMSMSLAQEKVPEYKILIVTGGHDFDVKEFYEMFDALPGITYDKARLPHEMDLLAPGLEKKYDAVVSYDMNNFPITDVQRMNFDKLMQTGIPLVVFHHSICGYKNWPKYREIAGGAYLFEKLEIDGKTWPSSAYKHDIEMKITIADKDHPITRGVDDFVILDEAYKDVYVRPDVHVLLTTDNPFATKQVAWVHHYGNSLIFTIMLGHDKHAFSNENLRKLLTQGIDWIVSEKK